MSGSWSWLVLRPAAIYGPGRGVHTAMRAGTHRLLGDGGNFISRIHVEDLAAHAEAGLLTDLSGVWPVADDEPCPAREISEYCAQLLGIAPPADGAAPLHSEDTRQANRRVNGRAIRSARRRPMRSGWSTG